MQTSRFHIVLIAAASVIVTLAYAHAGTPSWIGKRPAEPGYYVGIGTSEKRGSAEEYLARAKHSALNDIASQITVAVSGEQISRISEQLGKITDDYQAELRSSTSAELDGVETVDTYETDAQTWIYLRLNIDEYNRLRQAKIRRAASLGLDYFSKAKASEKRGKIGEAVQSYVLALSAVGKYVGEPVEATYDGRKIFLVNEIVQSLQTVLNTITIEPNTTPLDGQIGKPLKGAVAFTVRTTTASGVEQQGAMLPVRFSFLRGAGELVSSATTDQAGVVATRVAKITATDKLQMIQAAIELSPGSASDGVLAALVKGFAVPNGKVIVNVAGVSVYIRTEESQFGSALRLPRIEPALKGMLSSEGFSFTKQQASASISIDIKADSRQGSQTHGLCVAYADATVSVIDLSTGDEIYKNSVSNVKGISDTFEKAGMKAFDETAAVLKSEVIPLLLEKYRK